VPNLLVDVNSWRRSACSNCYPPFFVKKAEIFVKKSLWFTPKFRLCQRLKAKQFPPSLSVLLEDTPQILQCDSTLSKHRFFLPGLLRFFLQSKKMGKALTQAKKEIFPLVVEHSKKINQFFALQKGAAFFRKSMHSKAHENRKMFNYFHNCMYYYNIFCYSAGIFYDMLQICFCSVEKKELFLQFTDIFLVTFFSIFLKLEGQQAELLKLSLE
jgi:hypothetical protein